MTWFNRVVLFLLFVAICVILFLLWKKSSVEGDLALANSKLSTATAQHATDIAVHNEDVGTIKQLTSYKAANDRIEAQFVLKLTDIQDNFASLQGNIAQLRRTNADVEKYLSQPIPLVLACVLNGGVFDTVAANCSAKR